MEATGQFCWNLVTRELAEAMNMTSVVVDREVNEFSLAGLTPAPSRIVTTPHVAEARVVFECRATQIVDLRSVEGTKTGTRMVFGEVVGVHIDRDLLKDGIYQTALADPVLRAGGLSAYFTVDEHHRFDMYRPT